MLSLTAHTDFMDFFTSSAISCGVLQTFGLGVPFVACTSKLQCTWTHSWTQTLKYYRSQIPVENISRTPLPLLLPALDFPHVVLCAFQCVRWQPGLQESSTPKGRTQHFQKANKR